MKTQLKEAKRFGFIVCITRAEIDPGRDLAEIANWQVVLSEDLAARGIRPPIDLEQSSNPYAAGLVDAGEVERRLVWRSSLTGDPEEDAASLAAIASGTPQLDSVAGSGQ